MTPDSQRTCDTCEKFGAVAFAEEILCVDCYSVRGSSCAGSSKQVEPDDGGTTLPDLKLNF